MVSQVAPKPTLKMKVKDAAAAPNCGAFAGLLSAALDNPPARNIAIPMTTEPKYNDLRRPRRSKVKIANNVENCYP